jgi:hypothetical protein
VKPRHMQTMKHLPLQDTDDATLQHDLEHGIIC